jgi:hypothetical protein
MASDEPEFAHHLAVRRRDVKLDEAELQDVLDARFAADMRATARWRAAHPGNELVLPDHADLVVWLMEQLEQASNGLPFTDLSGNPAGTIPAPVAADLADLNARNAKMQRRLAAIVELAKDGLTADAETVGDIAEEFDKAAGRIET